MAGTILLYYNNNNNNKKNYNNNSNNNNLSISFINYLIINNKSSKPTCPRTIKEKTAVKTKKVNVR